MKGISHVFLCAAVILLVITAGCTFQNSSGARPLIPDTTIAAATPVPSAPPAAGTTSPGTAGTQAPGTCPADVSSDAANCGGCGYACPSNALCQQGQCYCRDGYTVENNQCVAAPAGTGSGNGCPTGMSACPDGYCYELASSAANCGICGNQCPAGMICSASTCTNVPVETTTAVPATTTAAVTTTSAVSSGPTLIGDLSKICVISGKTNCDGSCVNLSTDSSNCGSCGTKCTGPLMGCCKGTCKSYASDAANCGSCGHKCLTGSTCQSGSCKVKALVTLQVTQKVSLKITPIEYQQVVIPGI
jgi:hypothetical protein